MKIYAPILLAALVSGCATAYQDPRPLDVQQAELENSLKELSGQYEVIDARNDFYSFTKFEAHTLVVSRQGNGAKFLLVGKKDALLINGHDCKGRNEPDGKSPWLYCATEKGGFFAPVVERVRIDQEVGAKGLLSVEKPMQVKAGDYLFNFHESGSGRPHYYLLKKRPAVAE
ncbi:hypothetical protein GTP45_05765 [Pseudoduganella sp. FT55W]|uniref:Lipoprotein n=1 Tax=Duganella rivi TaxID=2666083 RepID=A0A7X4GMP9_9BURK|nr:hypothetical protein [Duganella rivi]MYM66342.1 hypothetical protein [Duganella rivi]